MPRKEFKLTWFEPRQQWRKFPKCKVTGQGSMYYLEPKGIKRSDHNAKSLAWKNWLAKLDEIERKEKRYGSSLSLHPPSSSI